MKHIAALQSFIMGSMVVQDDTPQRKNCILIRAFLLGTGVYKAGICEISHEGRGSVARKTEIKKDLLDQLERNGVYGKHYLDLVNDYMSLWEIKNKLIKDIKERGVSVKYDNGGGQSGFKKNDSIAELNKTNAQMLKILNELGLKPSRSDGDPDDGDMEM